MPSFHAICAEQHGLRWWPGGPQSQAASKASKTCKRRLAGHGQRRGRRASPQPWPMLGHVVLRANVANVAGDGPRQQLLVKQTHVALRAIVAGEGARRQLQKPVKQSWQGTARGVEGRVPDNQGMAMARRVEGGRRNAVAMDAFQASRRGPALPSGTLSGFRPLLHRTTWVRLHRTRSRPLAAAVPTLAPLGFCCKKDIFDVYDARTIQEDWSLVATGGQRHRALARLISSDAADPHF